MELIVFTRFGMCVCMPLSVCVSRFKEKQVINLRETKDDLIERLLERGGKGRKGKMIQLYLNFKNIIKHCMNQNIL